MEWTGKYVRVFAGFFGPTSRAIIACCIITYLFANVALEPVFFEPPPVDELTWVERSLISDWIPDPQVICGSEQPVRGSLWRYYFCIHHPTVARMVYRVVLRSAGFHDLPERQYNYQITYDENYRLGNILPVQMRELLRATNAVFVLAALILAYLALFVGAVVLLYFGFNAVLGNALLAVLAALPLALDTCVSNHLYSLVVYIGADALLYFLLALFWVLWLRPWSASAAGAVVLGVVGGLAACAKVNGAFVLCGAAAWYALSQRGSRRFLFPILMVAVAASLFIALNPVFLGGGLRWGVRVLKDLISNRVYIKNAQLVTQWGNFSHWETIFTTLPHLFLLVPAVALTLPFRKEWWFPATACWSVSIIALNLAMLYLFMPRYAAPVRMAFMVPVMASGARLLQELVHARMVASPGARTDYATKAISVKMQEEQL